MKKVTIYDDVHRDVKLEAVRLGRTFPNMASELLRRGLDAAKKDQKPLTASREGERVTAGK